MTIIKDPEGRETSALEAMVNFKDLRVLEIGCGDGRLTWRYADQAAHVTAIDPKSVDIETARANTPGLLKERVNFQVSTLEDFVTSIREPSFDVVVFAWSL